ncbi:uncharacterized protein TNCV_4095231 [Trichonephila clavipes]|uniref:Uncharacterized protein n=1 Tax=Trichonephila clavipes TaxID=2585209 RepID=A0A8X6SIN2_TRICX|nr:uncharacterized protein TNCV_4095231 [Trichonephila clavipes]
MNHGQVTWTTPELAPPLLTTTPHQREDVSSLDRFNVHRCPTRRVFSGTGIELVTRVGGPATYVLAGRVLDTPALMLTHGSNIKQLAFTPLEICATSSRQLLMDSAPGRRHAFVIWLIIPKGILS